jgi:hypothetical protein
LNDVGAFGQRISRLKPLNRVYLDSLIISRPLALIASKSSEMDKLLAVASVVLDALL